MAGSRHTGFVWFGHRRLRRRAKLQPAIAGCPDNPPAVRIVAPRDKAVFHAHANIRLLALATPYGTDLEPDADLAKRFADTDKWRFVQGDRDTFQVEFLANTNSLGLRTSGLTSAGVRPRRGSVTPTFMVVVGFPQLELLWTNAPAGSYVLTAKATNNQGRSTVSAPVTITVRP